MLAWMWRKGNPFVHWWRNCKLVQPLCKTVLKFLKKKKNESRATLPEIPLQGMYPKITKTLTWKDICIPMYCIPLCVCVHIYIYIYNVYWNIYIVYTTTFLSTNPFTDTHTHTHTHTHTMEYNIAFKKTRKLYHLWQHNGPWSHVLQHLIEKAIRFMGEGIGRRWSRSTKF